MREGKTTMWEKRANDSADQYAKMGASKHSFSRAVDPLSTPLDHGRPRDHQEFAEIESRAIA